MQIYNPFPNLDGYLLKTQTGQFASATSLYETGSYLFNLIGTISGGGNTGDSAALTQTGIILLQRINDVINTGYITTGAADLRFVHLTGNETISGLKIFRSNVGVKSFAGDGVNLTNLGLSGSYSLYGGGGPIINLFDKTIQDENLNIKLDWTNNILSGIWFVSGTTSNANSIVNFAYLSGVSGRLASQIAGAGVTSINGINGIINVTGTGGVMVSVVGQTLYVSGGATIDFSGYITSGQADLRYYPLNSNPSGYITGVNTGFLSDYLPRNETGQFASKVELTQTGVNLGSYINSASGGLQSNINLKVNQSDTGNYTGAFYPRFSNPSGYVNNIYVTGVSGALQDQISSINSQGYISSGIANSIFVHLTGDETISGTKTFRPNVHVKTFGGDGLVIGANGISGSYNSSTGAGAEVNIFDSQLRSIPNQVSIDWFNKILSGNWSTNTVPTQDQNIITRFYLTGASGALVNLISAASAGVSSLNGGSGVLNLVGTGNVFVTRVGQNIFISGSGNSAIVDFSGYITTGQADLRYYPILSNPNGYLTTGEAQNLFLTTGEASGLFYSLYNLSGYITGISTGNFISRAETGQFYPASNPSGFITTGDLVRTSGTLTGLINSQSGFNLSTYATISNLGLTGSNLYILVTGLSGQANSNFYLTSNPQFYAQSGFVTGSSGFLQTQINANVSSITQTGVLLGAKIDSLSGFANNFSGQLSQVRVTGSSRVPIVDISGVGSVTVTLNGAQLIISGVISTGGGIGGSGVSSAELSGVSGVLQGQIDILNQQIGSQNFTGEQNFRTGLATGSNLYFISFNPSFGSVPQVNVTEQLSNSNYVYPFAIKGSPTISGFTVQFAEVIVDTGIFLNVAAKTSTGAFTSIIYTPNNTAIALNVTGDFNIDSGAYRYIWTGSANGTGILPTPLSYSGIEVFIKNKSTNQNLLISGNIDNEQNQILASLGAFTLWSDGQTWNRI